MKLRGVLAVLAAAVGAALAAAQAVPVSRTNPPIEGEIEAPPEVAAILRRACYDCHSNETVWPWYARVAPVAWLVAHDVNEGREELNFSSWTAYTAKRRTKKLAEAVEEVEEGEMPPWFYLPLHPEARLAEADIETLRRFAAFPRSRSAD